MSDSDLTPEGAMSTAIIISGIIALCFVIAGCISLYFIIRNHLLDTRLDEKIADLTTKFVTMSKFNSAVDDINNSITQGNKSDDLQHNKIIHGDYNFDMIRFS